LTSSNLHYKAIKMGSMPENMTARQSIRAPNPPLADSVFKMFRMDGKTVIITGGSGGIGYEVARGLAEAGANVSELFAIGTASAKRV
jgi:sorbose reductase